MSELLLGVDVSHWQGVMNWARAKKAGVEFAFIKASEGTSYKDDQWRANVSGCMVQGIPWGIYHFWSDAASPADQARNVLDAWNFSACPIAIDVESFPMGLWPAANARSISELVERLEDKTGKRPTIYTSRTKWDGRVKSSSNWRKLPLWVANYGVNKPILPEDWTDWMVWQYTNNGDGTKYGAQSNTIDLNHVKREYLVYYGLIQDEAPEPPPVPDPDTLDVTMTVEGITYSGMLKRKV